MEKRKCGDYVNKKGWFNHPGYSRNSGIRTHDLFVPHEARYQTAPYSGCALILYESDIVSASVRLTISNIENIVKVEVISIIEVCENGKTEIQNIDGTDVLCALVP